MDARPLTREDSGRGKAGKLPGSAAAAPEKLRQFPKIINFLIDFLIILCYNKGGKTRIIAHHNKILADLPAKRGERILYMSKYPFNVPAHAFDVDDWGYDSDREIDTDFYSKAELEEFKIAKDLSGDHLNIELPETRKENHA